MNNCMENLDCNCDVCRIARENYPRIRQNIMMTLTRDLPDGTKEIDFGKLIGLVVSSMARELAFEQVANYKFIKHHTFDDIKEVQ